MTTSQPVSGPWRSTRAATGTGSPEVDRGVDVDAGLLGVDLELLDGGGALQVAGDQHRVAALGLQQLGELAGRGRLPGALQAGEHDDGGLPGARAGGLAAERPLELGVDRLDDLLRRVEGLGDLLADQRLAQPLDDALDDLEVDVRLEQGEADLLQRRVDGLLVEPAATLDRSRAASSLVERASNTAGLVGAGRGGGRARVARERRTRAAGRGGR
jgi:hypothetical protein